MYEDPVGDISKHYSDAVDFVSESMISSQLGEDVATPAACGIFRAIVRSISDGGGSSTESKGEKVVILSVSDEDLKYIAGGGLNVYATENTLNENTMKVVKVYFPEGCVMEILAKMSQAVQPTAVVHESTEFS